MSELKDYDIMDIEAMDDERLEKSESGKIQVTRVYIKSEADKVIEEKDAEIARLKAIRKVHVEAIESMGAGLLQDEEEKRHSKYKRCLAMYRYCSIKALYELDFKGNDVEWKWYSKWMHKWFELAKQFKEAK